MQLLFVYTYICSNLTQSIHAYVKNILKWRLIGNSYKATIHSYERLTMKKICLMLLLLCSTISLAADNNWMASVKGTTLLSQMSIPGTHDSGAMYEPFPGTAICQNLTISEQLNVGIRFLDIRCRHIDDAFTIHHGSIYQNLNFNDVLTACISFLNNNPSETIIMSVKEEYDSENITRTFEETFYTYLNSTSDKWYLGNSIPDLETVRGKIVLFRRFGCSQYIGLNATSWDDDTTFSISNNSSMRVQDNYSNDSASEKWSSVTSMISEATVGDAVTLFVNFTSGYTSFLGIPSITTVSDYVNPRLETYFTQNTYGRYGILVMDFANATRAELIYSTNFTTTIPSPPSTKAYWRFEDGIADEYVEHLAAAGTYSADINDYSDSGNHLSVWRTGPTGGYTHKAEVAETTIDKTGDSNGLSVVNCDSSPTMFCGNSTMRAWNPDKFTIEATIKFQTGSYRTYIGRDSYETYSTNSSLAALYIQATPNNALAFKFCDKAGNWHDATSTDNIIEAFNTDSSPYYYDVPWYSVAAISDGDVILLYLNNHDTNDGYQLIAKADITASSNSCLTTGSGSGSDWTAGDFTVGRGMYGGSHADRGYGYIDEVRFTDGDLDVTDLLYSSMTQTPVAWYQFGSNLNDAASDNDGSAPGAAVSYTTGINGTCLSLNGSDQYVQIPLSVTESFSIEMWVKTTATGGTGHWYNGLGLVDAERPNIVNDFGTSLTGSKFAFGVGNPDVTIASSTSINNGQWHHCVATRNAINGEMKIYIDGNLEATATGGTGVKDAPSNINIGRINTGINYIQAQFDEIRIYNYPITAQEAKARCQLYQ